jgi:hypothetical protein
MDFEAGAKKLRCDLAAIRAVAEVESSGHGMVTLPGDTAERPVILFERHKFFKFTNGDFARRYPDICNRQPGGYAIGRSREQRQRGEWIRFSLAFRLSPAAAMMSASWGKFQIMGFNFRLCGFDSVGGFVEKMKRGEQAHLDAFVEFLINTGLDKPLREHEWMKFKIGYNGPVRNGYEKKMAHYWNLFSKMAA